MGRKVWRRIDPSKDMLGFQKKFMLVNPSGKGSKKNPKYITKWKRDGTFFYKKR